MLRGTTEITRFIGYYKFLSNFYFCEVAFDGILYYSSEAAYMAQKTLDVNERLKFRYYNPFKAKQCGHKLKLRDDWEDIKIKIMYEIVKEKFKQNDDLKNKLLKTENLKLIEGNYWGDRFWGCDPYRLPIRKGENHLGKILMQVRKEIGEEIDE